MHFSMLKGLVTKMIIRQQCIHCVSREESNIRSSKKQKVVSRSSIEAEYQLVP